MLSIVQKTRVMKINFFISALLLLMAINVNAQNTEPENDTRIDKVIIKKKYNEHPKAFLGVATQKDGNGVKVSDVVEGSAAEKFGLEKGDVITKLNGKSIDDPAQFSDNIRSMQPGDEVELSVIKSGEKRELKIKVILGKLLEPDTFMYSMPDDYSQWDMPSPPPPPRDPRRRAPAPQERFGFRDFDRDMHQYFSRPFDERGERQKPQLGIHVQDTEESKGVKVIDVTEGSSADRAGIVENDLITDIDGTKVMDTESAKQALKNASPKPFYNIKLLRDGKVMVLELKNPKKLKEANL